MIDKLNFLNSQSSMFSSMDITKNEPISGGGLIEPGMKYYINETLKNCKKFKNRHYNFIYNIGMFLFFSALCIIILSYMYRRKNNNKEKQERETLKKHYILSKLHQLNAIRYRKNNNTITNLPTWDDHPELKVIHNKV